MASAVPSDSRTAADKIAGVKRTQALGNAADDNTCFDCGHPFMGASPAPVFA